MSNTELKEITAAIDSFDHAMLVTQRDGELRSRPMAVGDCTEDGRIRFITSDDSGKVDEVIEQHDVNVALQGESKFLSISGKARLTKDRELIKKSWQPSQAAWFSEGSEDPHVMVLEVVPIHAEYWDRTGTSLVRSVFDRAHGSLGKTVDRDSASQDRHLKVDLTDKPL